MVAKYFPHQIDFNYSVHKQNLFFLVGFLVCLGLLLAIPVASVIIGMFEIDSLILGIDDT